MIDKREQLWRQRWARAEQVLGEQGVMLKSWRVGEDAADVSIKLLKEHLERGKRDAGRAGNGHGK